MKRMVIMFLLITSKNILLGQENYIDTTFSPCVKIVSVSGTFDQSGFSPKLSGTPNAYKFTIQNRNGIVFESEDPNEVWDGKVKGKYISNEVYIWVLSMSCKNPNYFKSYAGSSKSL